VVKKEMLKMDKSTKTKLTWLVIFTLVAGLTLSLICLLSIPQLNIVVGLLIGWLLVDRAYVPFDGRMTLVGDILLFIATLVIFAISNNLTTQWCAFMMPDQGCLPYLQKSCLFSMIFAVGISEFSLWLWFRSIQWRNS
jgi:hypothetical protein